MKQNTQQIRTKLLTVIMAGVAGVGFATAATAAGVGVDVNTNVSAGAQVAAPNNAQAGGSADAHMSTSGSANSNAQWQSGATRGADRAAERMGTNVDGLKQSTTAEFEAAGQATVKAKRPGTR
ncbi:MAG: hypothetical protein Q8K35_08400 [Thiobacillus sp.]|nr:hypothetical protein [Thiobacillus sp.]MDP2057758.1 hypothetical protein [Thiobacillus sp.]